MTHILITGANRGIGYAIAQAIAARPPSSNIILGCRSKDAAQEAIRSLRETGVTTQLNYVEIDIESDTSIEAAVLTLEREYGRLDGK
jgi:NAD(P)-dependent dehydrogenase (short-subunit alcohol dehydrogenase family)